ncbi:hypothetical protein [Tardibacter chloracetimidivorans]|uniref:hypothetical protein n=1 Tax=Tardibacter chloracetimidivorans TaxID=1921510 RepID=UPI0013906755|nr:hypothetical protein [Tardibacter chloracetimidivorans]
MARPSTGDPANDPDAQGDKGGDQTGEQSQPGSRTQADFNNGPQPNQIPGGMG